MVEFCSACWKPATSPWSSYHFNCGQSSRPYCNFAASSFEQFFETLRFNHFKTSAVGFWSTSCFVPLVWIPGYFFLWYFHLNYRISTANVGPCRKDICVPINYIAWTTEEHSLLSEWHLSSMSVFVHRPNCNTYMSLFGQMRGIFSRNFLMVKQPKCDNILSKFYSIFEKLVMFKAQE